MDYLVRGRYDLVPKDAERLEPENLFALTASSRAGENPSSAGIQASGAATGSPAVTQVVETAYSGQKEMKANQ